MQLFLHNIGKFKDASITVDGITVIAGENNTGKSTVGKALFLYLHSLLHMEEAVRTDSIETIQREMQKPLETLDRLCRRLSNAQRRHKVSRADEIRRKYAAKIVDDDYDALDQLLDDLAVEHAGLYGLTAADFENAREDYESWKKTIGEEIENLLKISDRNIAVRKVSNDVDRYFSGDLITIGSRTGEIRAEYADDKKENVLRFERDSKGARDLCVGIIQEETVLASPVYMESPKTVDQLYRVSKGAAGVSEYFSEILSPNALGASMKQLGNFHTEMQATATQQAQADELTRQFSRNIEDTVGGSLQFNAVNGLQFQENGKSRVVDISNLSNGIKSLTLLEYAIECGCLGHGDCLILDEPEINLHPAWQIRYAEQIVYLQKLLGISVVLTTHTPYFLEAVELYTRKYEIEKRCHYYTTEIDDHGDCQLREVTGNTEPIFAKLAKPFEDLDALRSELENRS